MRICLVYHVCRRRAPAISSKNGFRSGAPDPTHLESARRTPHRGRRLGRRARFPQRTSGARFLENGYLFCMPPLFPSPSYLLLFLIFISYPFSYFGLFFFALPYSIFPPGTCCICVPAPLSSFGAPFFPPRRHVTLEGRRPLVLLISGPPPSLAVR